MTEIKAPE